MADLERALIQLDVEWPATPAFDLGVAGRRRRWALAGAAALLAAVGIAFAVPPARSAILRFLHLRGVTIERVDTLPPAQERSLRASLGIPIGRAEVRRLLGRRFALDGVPLYRSGRTVSALYGSYLLSEVRTGPDTVVMKKFAGGSTDVVGVPLAPDTPAIWIHGGSHVYMTPTLPARYAGNTLLWQRGSITYRLEGRGLTLDRARALARPLR